MIGKILTAVGIPANKKNYFRARVIIIVSCLLVIIGLLIFSSESGSKYGNNDEVREQYPELFE